MHNGKSFLLCCIAAIIFLVVGFNEGTATIVLVFQVLQTIPALDPIFPIIGFILLILWLIAYWGGFSILLGGLILTSSHVRLGKLIVAIASGFGLISLILVVLWVFITTGIAGLLVLTWLILNTAWAFALILTIIARHIAKER